MIKIVVTRLDRTREAEARRLNLSPGRSDRLLSTKEPRDKKPKYFTLESLAMIFPEKLNASVSLG